MDDLFVREGPYAIRVNDEFTVDVMPSACGHGWSELERFVEERFVDGVRLPVLALEGLLLTKEGLFGGSRVGTSDPQAERAGACV